MNEKTAATGSTSKPSWKDAVASYAVANDRRSSWQIINTLIPYIALWVLMYLSLDISYWLTLLLAIPAAGFMVRLFIQFHDAGHGSFFSSSKANEVWGIITGILTFTPYHHWRHSHAVHHASVGNLDKRGVGDVWTYTVDEWLKLPPLKRFGYRVYRHPIIMFGAGPLFMFLVSHRFAGREPSKKARRNVIATNLAILAMVVLLSLLMGFKAYILVQLPIIWIGGMVGIWLFYVQHQFEDIYWERGEEWDFFDAALKGSSYYKLPVVLRWFTGNIGVHHIHHLNPRIPNYNLQTCYDTTPEFQIPPITLVTSLKTIKYRLYDEVNRSLIGFREARRLRLET